MFILLPPQKENDFNCFSGESQRAIQRGDHIVVLAAEVRDSPFAQHRTFNLASNENSAGSEGAPAGRVYIITILSSAAGNEKGAANLTCRLSAVFEAIIEFAFCLFARRSAGACRRAAENCLRTYSQWDWNRWRRSVSLDASQIGPHSSTADSSLVFCPNFLFDLALAAFRQRKGA